jgi:hypothetical protein
MGLAEARANKERNTKDLESMSITTRVRFGERGRVEGEAETEDPVTHF